MNIVALIPARGDSKSIVRKNLKLLGGKPLIVWSIESAYDAEIQRVIVNTDDIEIAEVAKVTGAEIMMRPPELGQDDTSMYELLKSEIPKIDPQPEIVLLFQPTSPFRKKVHIKTALSYFVNSTYNSLISVEKVPNKYHPDQVIVNIPTGLRMATGIPISKRKTKRQDHGDAWIPDGSLYIFRPENLQKGSIYGEKTMIYENEGTININTLEDFELAEQKLK